MPAVVVAGGAAGIGGAAGLVAGGAAGIDGAVYVVTGGAAGADGGVFVVAGGAGVVAGGAAVTAALPITTNPPQKHPNTAQKCPTVDAGLKEVRGCSDLSRVPHHRPPTSKTGSESRATNTGRKAPR